MLSHPAKNDFTQQISGIIFDLDGTLIDSYPGIEFSIREAVDAVLPGTTIADLSKRIGPPIREIFLSVFQDLHADQLDELVRRFRSSYDVHGCYRVTIYPDVVNLLSKLNENGIPCFLATNKPKIPTRKILAFLKLENYFNQTLCRDDRQPPYPTKKEMVETLLTENNLNSEKVILVGDMPEDAEAAAWSKLKFAFSEYGYGDKDLIINGFPVHYRLKTLNELLTLV